jgi:outer membrane lipoprotein SlyB
MTMRQSTLILLLTGLVLGGGACTSTLTGDVYSRSEARQEQRVEFGQVEYVRPVVIEGTRTPIGAASGAAVGGIAGSSVGGGKGSDIATVVGAVTGGLAGAAVEDSVTRRQGVEVTVRLSSNDVIAVVQEASPHATFRVGDRVRILSRNGVTRITH